MSWLRRNLLGHDHADTAEEEPLDNPDTAIEDSQIDVILPPDVPVVNRVELMSGAGACLPVELRELILSYAAYRDRATAAAIAQVCHSTRSLGLSALYATVILRDDTRIALFRRTCTENAELAALVRNIAILGNACPGPSDAGRSGAVGPVADRILQRCTNAVRVLIDRPFFFDWSPGLFAMKAAEEVTLINASRKTDLDGLLARHEANIVEAMRGEGVSLPGIDDPALALPLASGALYGDRVPLRALHLCSVEGRLLADLVPLTGLTHITLTHPTLPRHHGQAPSLAVLPRAHVLFLLRSTRLRRLLIRGHPYVLSTIAWELAPIEDDRLRFRALADRSYPKWAPYAPKPGRSPVMHAFNLSTEWRAGAQGDKGARSQRGSERSSSPSSGTEEHSSPSAISEDEEEEEEEQVPFMDYHGDIVGATVENAAHLSGMAGAIVGEMPWPPGGW